MFEYDVWILNNSDAPSIMMAISKGDALEAIKTAREIAGERPFEVWGDRGRIYTARAT